MLALWKLRHPNLTLSKIDILKQKGQNGEKKNHCVTFVRIEATENESHCICSSVARMSIVGQQKRLTQKPQHLVRQSLCCCKGVLLLIAVDGFKQL